jgi:hypothetical protein
MQTTTSPPLDFDAHALAVWPLLAEWRDAKGVRRVESTRPFDVTQQGASFRLTRPPEVGQLMHLTLPVAMMRRQHRGSGLDAGFLALAWAVSDPLPEQEDEAAPPRSVSVLFLGPASASTFAATEGAYTYGIDDGGLFRLQPRAVETSAAAASLSDKREESRLDLPIEVTLEAFDRSGNVTMREQTVTENISRKGALVPTTLLIPPDSTVRLTNAERRISLNAVVRARRVGQNGVARLHLHIPEDEWPLDGLY